MDRNPLDYMPLTVKRLKEMDRNSDDYEFLLEDAFSILSARFDLLSYVKNSKEAQFAPIIKRSRGLVVASYVSVAISLAAMTFCIIIIGDTAMTNLGFERITIAAAALALFVLGLIMAAVFMKNSQVVSIDALEVMADCYTGDDSYDESMLDMLGTAGMLLFERIEGDNTPCCCLACRTVFNSKAIVSTDDADVQNCPFCGEPYIIPEKDGIIISDAFLDAANDYWYEKNKREDN